MTCHTLNKRLLWQPLMRMVIDKICKMTVKGAKSKSESFFSIARGVLELWRKILRGADSAPPGLDRVKGLILWGGKTGLGEIKSSPVCIDLMKPGWSYFLPIFELHNPFM